MKLSTIALPITISLFTVITLGACSDDSASTMVQTQKSTVNDEASETIASTQDNIQTYHNLLPEGTPSYSVGVMLNAPYHFKDEYGNSVGYDIDIIRAIGEEAGFNVNFNQMDRKKIFTTVEEGDVDLIMSGLSHTPERQKTYATSQPYSKSKSGYMVLDNLPYQDKASLNDKRIGVLEGANSSKILADNSDAILINQPTKFLSFKTILNEEADAVFGFEANLEHLSQQFKGKSFNFIAFGDDVYTAIYANKNQKELMSKVNAGFKTIQDNGKYQEVNKKWFGDKATNFSVN